MVRIYGDFGAVFLPPHHQTERGGCHPALQLHPTAALMVHDCRHIFITSGCSATDNTSKSSLPLPLSFFLIIPCFRSVDGRQPANIRPVLAGHRQQPGSCPCGLPTMWALAGHCLQQCVCHQNPIAGVTAAEFPLSCCF